MNVQTTFPQAALATEQDMANAIRALAMDAVEKAKSGHPGMPMGMADVAAVLFNRFIRIDPSRPDWPDRDRFILSAGHGSMLQYAIHYLLGYEDMPIEELARFRQLGARTAGHPEYGHAMGIETTTGPLGQGLATGVGMAIAERMMAARFGAELVDHHTYVIAGDGCLMEGISHEAIDLAGHLGLSRLIVFWDDNRITIDGATSLATSMDQPARFRAAGWHAQQVDGHDMEAIAAAIDTARRSDKPSLIACRTVIGKGAPNLQGSEKTHGAPLGAAEIAAARKNLGWTYPPFVVPEPILAAWRGGGGARRVRADAMGAASRRLAARAGFEHALGGDVADAIAFRAPRYSAPNMSQKATKVATRKASEMVLGVINTACEIDRRRLGRPHPLQSDAHQRPGAGPPGRLRRPLHPLWHPRARHGRRHERSWRCMAASSPMAAPSWPSADYARGAMRLSALMGQRVIYVLTHDSIGLGEDGPTHQPIEHLAMLRATPNLNVFRPADIIETAEAWEIALATRRSSERAGALPPGAADAARPATPGKTAPNAAAMCCARRIGPRDLTIMATGSEVQIAKAAAEELFAGHGVRAAVVSMPCWELFEAQSADYRSACSVALAARRGGSRRPARLGPLDRRTGCLHRHEFVRCQRAGGSALHPFRHYRRRRRRGGARPLAD